MATITYPNVGPAAGLAGALAELDPQVQLSYLRLRQARQAQADAEVARSLAPLIYGAQPQVESASSAAVPPLSVTTSVPPEQTAGLDAQASAEASQFRPSREIAGVPVDTRTIAAHTPESLMRAVGGPENYATAMRTPEGATAVQAMKPVTPEQFQKMKRREQAMLDYKAAVGEMHQKMEAGDSEGTQLAHMKALRAAVDGADKPSEVDQRLQQETERWRKLREDQRDKDLADRESPRLVAARHKAVENPDDPVAQMALMDALMSVRSRYYQELALRMLPEAQKEWERRSQQSALMKALTPITRFVNDAYASAVSRGVSPNPERLWADGVRQYPAEASTLQVAVLTGKWRLPEPIWNAFFPGLAPSVPKNSIQLAMRDVEAAATSKEDPTYWQKVAERVSEIELGKKSTPEQRVAREDYERARAEGAQLRNQLLKESREGKVKPEAINGLTLSISRLRTYRASPGLGEDERKRVDAQISDLQAVLDQAIQRQRGPAPANETPYTTKAGRKVSVRQPPGGKQGTTAEGAIAEAHRLKALGLTDQEAVAAMQAAGWDVK